MSWGEFLLVVGCVIFAVALIIFLVTGFVVPVAIFSLKAWEVIYRVIAWPFRSLWRMIFPRKEKKSRQFHIEEDDIDIDIR